MLYPWTTVHKEGQCPPVCRILNIYLNGVSDRLAVSVKRRIGLVSQRSLRMRLDLLSEKPCHKNGSGESEC
jgi:hypothetical protein